MQRIVVCVDKLVTTTQHSPSTRSFAQSLNVLSKAFMKVTAWTCITAAVVKRSIRHSCAGAAANFIERKLDNMGSALMEGRHSQQPSRF